MRFSDEADAGVLELLAGLFELIGLDEEDGTVVKDEAGAVGDADAGGGEDLGDVSESAGLIRDLGGEDFDEGSGEGMEEVAGSFGAIHEEADDAELADVGDADPVNIDPMIGQDAGDAGELVGFVFGEDGEESDIVHGRDVRVV